MLELFDYSKILQNLNIKIRAVIRVLVNQFFEIRKINFRQKPVVT